MKTTVETASIIRLGDAKLTVADRAEDVRGRKVVDSGGDEMGTVDDLLVDEREHKVRFLEVASGGFLGLGETKVLVPVDAISDVRSDEVRINQSRQRVAGAPRYDPQLVDRDYLGQLYGYYGYPPHWGPGYVYPRYPYYRR
jgi:sporulation protein YlmC with PRC-barrel domain